MVCLGAESGTHVKPVDRFIPARKAETGQTTVVSREQQTEGIREGRKASDSQRTASKA